MLIRPATRSDLPAVKMLWNRMIRDTTSTFTSIEKTDEALEKLLLERADRFLVAEENGKCSGFVTWGSFRAGDGYVRTAEHSIITEKTGQGTGRALMESALRAAHQQGIHVMVAGIGHENPPAVAFHQKLGFAKVGRLPQVGYKNGRWHDLILMSRITQTP